jgi:leucine dehydrogenase
MSIFANPDYDKHEKIVYGFDEASGLRAIIAVHNTHCGPALGGCRMYPYATDDEALMDVLRLSRGMTYKAAMAGLPLGGGKSVIIGNPLQDKTQPMFEAMGHFVDEGRGEYIVAQDSGISVEDLRVMATQTRHVSGINDCLDELGQLRSGDPSPSTAYGVFCGLKAAVKYRLDRDNLEGISVAVQGLGNVGFRLAELLHEAGASLIVADVREESVQRAADRLGAKIVTVDEILCADVDVFSPCALGGVVNNHSIDNFKAKVIAGAANNQLAKPFHGEKLMQKSILYAPDYVINAGGIIDAYYVREGKSLTEMKRHVEGIADILLQVFERSHNEALATNHIADKMAELRFKH